MTGTVYLWSGVGNITWGGQTWQGVGGLGSITAIEEGATVEARGITLNLSGILQSLLADVLQELQLGGQIIIYLGLFAGAELNGTPVIIWQGKADQPTITIGGESAELKLNGESRLVEMNTSVERRYTQDDQQMDFPGDLGFQFQSAIQSATISWGQSPGSFNNQ